MLEPFGHGSKSRLAPSEHPNRCTHPKTVQLVLTHSHLVFGHEVWGPQLTWEVCCVTKHSVAILEICIIPAEDVPNRTLLHVLEKATQATLFQV